MPTGEHVNAAWELRVDAMQQLLNGPERPGGPLMTVDELRRGVEALSADDYAAMPYYRRWAESIARIMVERGLLDEAGLHARVEALERGAR